MKPLGQSLNIATLGREGKTTGQRLINITPLHPPPKRALNKQHSTTKKKRRKKEEREQVQPAVKCKLTTSDTNG